MSHYRPLRLSLIVAAIVVSAVPSVFAQPLGTFRWQFAPYCNVVTLYAVQQPNDIITLSGTDDQCGGTSTAAAVGTAHLNPSGTVGISVVVTRPDGIALSSTGEVSLVTGVGQWKDDSGNSGTFEISPPSPATGTPRRITLRGVYSAGFIATGAGAFQLAQISFGRTLPVPPSAPDANIIALGGVPTANCPGSFDNPQALPGQLCLYEQFITNGGYRVANSAGVFELGDRIGAHVYTVATAEGGVAVAGAWAVTIP